MKSNERYRTEHVRPARRIVVKVGTNVLAPAQEPGGGLDEDRVRSLVDQIAALVKEGRQVALVTSGAIGCGMAALGPGRSPGTLPGRQAAASVGQGLLMAHYSRHFQRHGIHAAQILLTHEDLDERRRYLNAANTIHALFELSCVPVINENDSISTEEIKFGDNDRLAALVTHLVRAELLILLTSVPGLYKTPPQGGRPGETLSLVERVDERVRRLAYDETAPGGLGGMSSKIEAARIATEAGGAAVIADGRSPHVLRKIMSAEPVGTLFLPVSERLSSYKRWIRFTSRPRGSVRVDAGARDALVRRGKSLLPGGVLGVQGRFKPGDVVRLVGPEGEEFARGLANYSHEEIARIKG
ncbi:MAG: glutamate 5-kinase, partial [Planctomycetes bacterium]|nr:glutamate 5-kinase [Planctomycetota bacterium]